MKKSDYEFTKELVYDFVRRSQNCNWNISKSEVAVLNVFVSDLLQRDFVICSKTTKKG